MGLGACGCVILSWGTIRANGRHNFLSRSSPSTAGEVQFLPVTPRQSLGGDFKVMSIDRFDFENIDENDLTELLSAQVPENLKLDYKKEIYGNSDADKRELLKDISAFANAQGGHLIIGIEETGGTPIAIEGVTLPNPDAELLRIDSIIHNAIEPRVQNVRTRFVPLANGRGCIIARVPNSWQKPHRVIAQNSNRFFVRNSRNITEPNVQELRMLFSQNGTILEKIRSYRDESVQKIIGNNTPRPLVGNGRLIMHIMPFAAFSDFRVDLEKIRTVRDRLRPIGATGFSPSYNLDGYILARGGEQNHGYTQIFRNGIVEATKASIIRQNNRNQPAIPGIGTEEQIFEVFDGYITALRDADVPTPLVISFVLEGVGNAYYAVNTNGFDDDPPPLGRDIIILPECIIEDYGQRADHHRAVKPAFDALWNASEFISAQTFNDDGLWVGIRR